MVKFKKVLAGLAAGAVVATQGLFGVAQAAEAGYPQEFQEALQWGYENGLTSYNTFDEFMPYGVLNREQAAKFFGVWAEDVLGKTPDTTRNCEFNDADQITPVLRPYVVKACQLGLFNGDADGNFNPHQQLSKAVALVLIVRALEGQKDENATPWWRNYYERAAELGITNDSMDQVAQKPAYRIETMVMLYRAAQDQGGDLADLLDDILGGTDEGTTDEGTDMWGEDMTGDMWGEDMVAGADVLDVSVSPDSPAEVYAPNVADRLIVGKVDFQAGDADVNLERATFKLEGLVGSNDVDKVYLLNENEEVVTTQRSFDDTTFEATVFFNEDDVVPANTVKSYYVAVDYDGASNRVFDVTLKNVEVAGDTQVQGAFPLRFATVQVVSYGSVTGTFYGDYAVKATDPTFAGTPDEVEVGDTNVMLGDFDFKIDTPSGRDAWLKSVKLKAISTIDGVIDNVRLEDEDGVVVASGADIVIDGRYITFTFPGEGYAMEDNDTITFEIYADVVGGDEGDYIQFYLRDEKDIVAFEKDTNIAATVVVDGGNKYLEANKITAPKNYISKSDETPASSYIPVKTDNALVLVANFNVEDDMNVDTFTVNFAGTATSTDITSVRFRLDDVVIGEEDFAASVPFDYEDVVTKGAHKLYVYVDVDENATENNTVKASIDVTALENDSEYVNSDNTVVIDGSADGPTYTIKKPAIVAVSRTDDATNGDVLIAGQQSAQLLKFKVAVNNIRDVELRSFDFTVSSGDDSVDAVRLMYNGNEVGNVTLNGNNGRVSSIDVIIPRGGAAEFELVADIDADYTGSLQATVTGFKGQDTEGVDVEYNMGVAGAIFTVKDSSSINGTLDNTNTPRTSIVAADGDTRIEVLRFQLEAKDADARLEELTLVNVDKAFTGVEVTGGVSKYTGADNVVTAVKLYDSNGNFIAEAWAGLVDGVAYFALPTPYTLTKDEKETFIVKVKANVNDVTKTNKYVRFGVLKPGEEINTFVTKIVSTANNEDVTVNTFETIGYPQYMRATIPTFAASDNTVSDVRNGVRAIYEFSVTAANGEDVALKQLVFDVTTGGGATATGWELYTVGTTESAFDNNDVTYTLVGNTLVVEFTGAYVDGYDITAGSTENFRLKAELGGYTADTATMSVKLDQKSSDLGVYVYTGVPAPTAVIWSDNADGDASLTEVDWFTDAEVPGLPAGTWTLNY